MAGNGKGAGGDGMESARTQVAIEKITRENKQLKKELQLESKQDQLLNSVTASAEIKRLQDQGDNYTRKIELERRRIVELEKQIEIVQAKVNAQRKKMGGINVSKQNNEILTKQIRVLENRLDKATVRYNEMIGGNKLTREKIEDLRKERLIFDGIYRKLEREMHNEKKKMSRLVEECNAAYKERDEVKSKIEDLKQQAEKEQADFEAEWKRLGDLIEQDKKEAEKKLKVRIKQRNPTNDERIEEAKKKLVPKPPPELETAKCEEVFERIQQETGVKEVERIVDQLVEKEKLNHHLFKAIQRTETEIQALERRLGEGAVNSDVKGTRSPQKQRLLSKFQTDMAAIEAKTKKAESEVQTATKALEKLINGLEQICLQVDNDEVKQILAQSNGTVTKENLVQIIDALE